MPLASAVARTGSCAIGCDGTPLVMAHRIRRGDTVVDRPALAPAETTPPARSRSLELREKSFVITITVRSVAGRGPSIFSRIRSVVRRLLGRAGPAESERLEPAELPPQLGVLSHYQQALQGLSGDEELADAVGVGFAELEQWKSGQMPSDEKLRRLRDLATVVARLGEYYAPAAIPDWLYGQNPDLGGRRPVELLREGNLADVLSAAEAQISGTYI
jgi:transcriptional regulator with XRE-family HTH domain